VSVEPIAVTDLTDREPMSFLFVRVAADDGLVGYGEACDSYGCSYASVLATMISDVFAPLVIGQPIGEGAFGAEAIGDRLRLFTRRRLGEGWIAAHARSAIELAVWDLIGRRAGTSVSHLIGRRRDRVEVYASMGFLEEGDAKEHIDSVRPLLERGVTGIKTRVGRSGNATSRRSPRSASCSATTSI
jgi:L-alanine-DL-glutamate epimerase-like enolase superfamily enzyme